jgi:serine O-acetyltransferase
MAKSGKITTKFQTQSGGGHLEDWLKELYSKKYQGKSPSLCAGRIRRFAHEGLDFLFPQRLNDSSSRYDDFLQNFKALDQTISSILSCFDGVEGFDSKAQGPQVREGFQNYLAILEAELTEDAAFIQKEDPAARSLHEVIICYPGFFAIAIYRMAHFFHKQEVPLFPRVLCEYAHEKTGIDIHPGAQIQSPFFIDHGTGVVVGETTRIGKRVKLFQGVTLGARSVHENQRNKIRHPKIEDDCLIYSNATILGGDTIIGEGSVVGGNMWITRSVPKGAKVFKQRGEEV